MNSIDLAKALRNTGFAALAALAANGVSAGVMQDNVEQRSVVVKYAAADIATEQGVAALYERLERASRAVCGKVEARDLARLADWRACRAAALDGAVAEVNDQRLTRVHFERSNTAQDLREQVAGTR